MCLLIQPRFENELGENANKQWIWGNIFADYFSLHQREDRQLEHVALQATEVTMLTLSGNYSPVMASIVEFITCPFLFLHTCIKAAFQAPAVHEVWNIWVMRPQADTVLITKNLPRYEFIPTTSIKRRKIKEKLKKQKQMKSFWSKAGRRWSSLWSE